MFVGVDFIKTCIIQWVMGAALLFIVACALNARPMPVGSAWHHLSRDLGKTQTFELREGASPEVKSLTVEYGAEADRVFIVGRTARLEFVIPHSLEKEEILIVKSRKCEDPQCFCVSAGRVLLKPYSQYEKHIMLQFPSLTPQERKMQQKRPLSRQEMLEEAEPKFDVRVPMQGVQQPQNFCTYEVDADVRKFAITRTLYDYKNKNKFVVSAEVDFWDLLNVSVDPELRNGQGRRISPESGGQEFIFSEVPCDQPKKKQKLSVLTEAV